MDLISFHSSTPRYLSGKKTFSICELVNILLTRSVPNYHWASMIMLLNTLKLKSADYVRADDLGVWVNNGVHRVWLTCKVSAQSVSRIEILGYKPCNLPSKHFQLYFYRLNPVLLSTARHSLSP